jgi:2,3-bisphosphoglycerate-independent phosphoglycerate mutase
MKKTALIILDGWGKGDGSKSDAIANANTPFIDACYLKYPNCELITYGEDVGLPDGQMGNSEVGHLNIGAGRIVYQDLVKINKAIANHTFEKNEELQKLFDYVKKNNVALHLMGLVSDGGIHSHQNHLFRIIELAHEQGIEKIYVHAFTDGRDCDPHSGINHLEKTIRVANKNNAKVVSVIGRYYAMDRDKRWERIKLAYDLLLFGKGEKTKDILNSVNKSYDEGVTDEFIKPIVLVDDNDNPVGRINENDAVFCFNFRTDRCREITTVLTQKNMPEFGMKTIPLYYVTMTNYDHTFKGVHIIFDKDDLKNTIGEIISKKGLKQIRIAETEKYPHVTFFFSGGREKEFDGEKRIMIPSPKVATYDLKPEMSAYEVTDAIVNEIHENQPDFIVLNFANCDMVGHTGVYDAIIKAVETVDTCTQKVVEAGLQHEYSFVIIADHGNADYALNPDGSPNTAHSKNPVPCIVIDKDVKKVRNGKLADIAPSILKMMNIEIPNEMTGDIIFE